MKKFLSASLLLLFPMIAQAKEAYTYDHKVLFSYSDYEEERDYLKTYFKEEMESFEIRGKEKNPDKYKVSLGIDKFDLNGDGQKDLLVYFDAHDMCPRHGCFFHIFVRNGKKYKHVTEVMTHSDGILISGMKTKGFRDIVFHGCEEEPPVWKWNGKKYD